MNTKPIPDHHQKNLQALSHYLRELRFNENLSQLELSYEINLHQNTIQRMESNKNYSMLSFFEICHFYDYKPSEILSILDD